MIGPIAHRGPDDDGVWLDEPAGIALGFRRLAILDVSPAGHQPMSSASGRFVLVFNGEIYNFAELRHQLERHGHRFRGRSDTEVLLAGFEQWGVRPTVSRSVGMFAMAVWDALRRELSLVRDRMGKKPLFVYREPGLITFGSELKALMAGPAFDRTLNRAALASYLRYLYVPAPQSIFERAIKLAPAHMLTVSDPERPLPASEAYWSLRDVAAGGVADPLDGSEIETVDAFDALLRDAVTRRLHADVPLGALLSGGIDSSAVVSLMQEASSRPVRTFTIGFADEDFNEARHAARVARHIGTEHTELRLTGEDARSLVPRLPEIFDEPFGDPSELPTLLVSQLARRHVTVALSGDGGDELFGGYNRYVYGTRILPRVSRMPRPFRQLLASGLGVVPASAWAHLSGALAGLPGMRAAERADKLRHLMKAPSVGSMYGSLLSAWQHPEDVVAGYHAAHDHTEEIVDGAEPSGLLERMMLADQLSYLPDDLLAKLDRASMAVSLEVRAPLLDHRVVEFSWRVPASLKVRGDHGKWILRQVLYRRVPRDLVERPKMGFSVPIDRWLRGPLREWADSLLSPSALGRSGWLTPAPIVEAWNGLKQGRCQRGAPIWAVLMLQAWRARWQL
jgi:asparagine synthase (glutamine-hydrolysing)